MGALMGNFGLLAGAGLIALLIAIPIVYYLVSNPQVGTLILITMAYFVMFAIKFTPFPLGTMMDALEWMLILGFFIQQKRSLNLELFKNPVSLVVGLWVAYNLLQVFNPVADSMLAWLFTVRTIGIVTLMYFVFMSTINTIAYIRVIIKMWLVFAIIAAIYGIKQEHFGYAEFEWSGMSPGRAALLLIDGHWRKFSIFEGPVTFAYNMVLASLLCVGLMWGVKAIWKKIILIVMIVMCFMSMLYSGTRGAFALIPAGLILFCILNFNKTTLVFGLIGAGIFVTLIFIPTTDDNLMRFQTAFKPNKDPSYLLRQTNQARIKPYIQSHPFGGGLGSVGVWGQKFSPNSMLSKFPPDSGYVRVAVETGWVGLLLICTLMFVVLYAGIKNFYTTKNTELRAYGLAMVIMIFALEIGNYPQEALVQFPSNIYFYLMIAIMVRCGQIDKRLQEEEEAAKPVMLQA
jgi:putative inorganic carbon (HCO3(-)) transporter